MVDYSIDKKHGIVDIYVEDDGLIQREGMYLDEAEALMTKILADIRKARSG